VLGRILGIVGVALADRQRPPGTDHATLGQDRGARGGSEQVDLQLSGDPDYLLRVVTADLDAYRRLYDERLAALPGVQRLTSTLVMKDVVAARPMPLVARS
jgi:Lrp/AsnC ligand binding domain